MCEIAAKTVANYFAAEMVDDKQWRDTCNVYLNMHQKSPSTCEMAVANLKAFLEPSLNLLVPNVI